MPQNNKEQVIEFLSEVNTFLQTHTPRKTDINPDTFFADTDDKLLIVQGIITLENSSDANRIFEKLVALNAKNQQSIEFGGVSMYDNTDHYPNPLPDILINSDIKGNRSNLDKYNLRN